MKKKRGKVLYEDALFEARKKKNSIFTYEFLWFSIVVFPLILFFLLILIGIYFEMILNQNLFNLNELGWFGIWLGLSIGILLYEAVVVLLRIKNLPIRVYENGIQIPEIRDNYIPFSKIKSIDIKEPKDVKNKRIEIVTTTGKKFNIYGYASKNNVKVFKFSKASKIIQEQYKLFYPV